MNYSREFGSNFPNSVMDIRTFKDVDETVISLVKKVREYQAKGDYASSKAILEDNAELLKDYMLSSDYFNLLAEETRNLEIYAMGNQQQTYYTDVVPTDISSTNDVWIGE